MKTMAIAFGVIALGCGLIAAWYWYKATRILFEPEFWKLPDDVSESDFNWTLVKAIMVATHKTAELNRLAALWTATAVVLGGTSNLLGALALN